MKFINHLNKIAWLLTNVIYCDMYWL